MNVRWPNVIFPAGVGIAAGLFNKATMWNDLNETLNFFAVMSADVLVRLVHGVPFSATGILAVGEARRLATTFQQAAWTFAVVKGDTQIIDMQADILLRALNRQAARDLRKVAEPAEKEFRAPENYGGAKNGSKPKLAGSMHPDFSHGFNAMNMNLGISAGHRLNKRFRVEHADQGDPTT